VPDDERELSFRAAERLTFFSDAVVAIALTLLAIELPVPTGGTVARFWTSFEHDEGHYAGFLISFAVISAAWADHHDLFRYATDTDARLRLLNSGWLLSIVLTPFATRLLVVSEQTVATHALRFGFYALLQVLGSATLYAMLRHMTAARLAVIPPPAVEGMTRRCYTLMLAFGLSIPVFFATTYAWVLWLAAPMLTGYLRRRQRRRPLPNRRRCCRAKTPPSPVTAPHTEVHDFAHAHTAPRVDLRHPARREAGRSAAARPRAGSPRPGRALRGRLPGR